MKNVKLTIEYEGTNFCGWQRQDNGRTVQEEIEKALNKVLKKEVKVHGSGRTDAGVHALGQVANFVESFTIPVEKIPLALNAALPEDISIKEVKEVEMDFHARYSAKGKRYIYKIYNDPLRSPLYRNFAYFVPQPLEVERMKEAAKAFIGEYDFKGFMSSGSSVKDTVRKIYGLDLYVEKDLVVLAVEGNGFLYNMVRIVAGTLIDVGKKKIDPNEMSEIILSGERRRAGHTAPAQGLYLAKVYYDRKEF